MADLNNGTYWSEVDASNNSASPNGWPEGMMPSGVNDAARADKGALKRFWDRINPVQPIAPAGGVWTFNTSNASYPTAYVKGEVYSFWSNGNSSAGDYFRVNALPSKRIYTLQAGSWTLLKAFDIIGGQHASLIYEDVLDAGAGGFALINPYVPIFGDGTGNGTMLGGLSVSGTLSTAQSLSVGTNATIGGSLLINGTGNSLYVPNGNIATNGRVLVGASQFYNDGTTAGLIFNGAWAWSQALATGVLTYRNNLGTAIFTIDNGGSVQCGNIAAGSITGTDGHFTTLATTGNTTFAGTVFCGGASVTGTMTSGAVSTGSITGTDAHFTTIAATGVASIAGTVFCGGVSATGAGSFGGTLTLNAAGTALNITGGNVGITGRAGIDNTGSGFNPTTGGVLSPAVYLNGPFGGGIVLNDASSGGLGCISMASAGTIMNLGVGPASGVPSALSITAGSIGIFKTNPTTAQLDINGGLRVSTTGLKPGGGAWGDSSDIRTKDADSIADYTQGLAAVLQLRPVSFRKNGRGGTVRDGKTYIGLVADDVLPVMPEMVGRIAEKLDPDDKDTTDILTVDATALLYALTNAVKTLAADLDALKAGEPHAADGPTPRPRPHGR